MDDAAAGEATIKECDSAMQAAIAIADSIATELARARDAPN